MMFLRTHSVTAGVHMHGGQTNLSGFEREMSWTMRLDLDGDVFFVRRRRMLRSEDRGHET